MSNTAFVFPGQGSQAVGMGIDLAARSPAARDTFAEADAALGFSLSTLLRDGPSDLLALTENAQPAIVTVAVAAYRAFLEHKSLVPVATAGHSLGEYAALVAAGAMTFKDAVVAVRARGRLMQQAVPVGVGAMAAVINLPAERVTEILAALSTEAAPVTVAGYNSPEQITISGTKEAVERAAKALTEAGARRVLPLKVSAPFHCPLMRPVEMPLLAVLEPMPLSPMTVPVVTNVTAQPNQDLTRVKPLLIEQLTAPVRFIESVAAFRSLGVTRVIEFGAGRTLTGFIKKIDPTLAVFNVEDGASLDATLAAF